MKYDSVKEIKVEEATSCKSLGNFEAKGNSVVVKSQEKVGPYGNIARGEGFSCP